MKYRPSDHDELRAALSAVRESTLSAGAPQHVERSLIEAMRQHPRPAMARRFRPSRVLFAAAAVLVCAVPAAFVWMSSLRPVAVQPAEAAIRAFRFELPARPVQEELPARATAVPKQQSAVPSEIVTAFLPLEYSGPAPDAYQVVRVKMDRSSLVQYGLPVNPERSDEPLDADLLVGNDGVPRAVRFVNLVTSTSSSLQDWRNQ